MINLSTLHYYEQSECSYLSSSNRIVDLVYGYILTLTTEQIAELFVFMFNLQYVGSEPSVYLSLC